MTGRDHDAEFFDWYGPAGDCDKGTNAIPAIVTPDGVPDRNYVPDQAGNVMNRQIPTQSDIPMHGWYPYHLVHWERIRAHEKHDGHGNSMERSSWDDPRWLPVLTEEVGELARAVCELTRRDPMSDDERTEWLANLRSELVQVGAMAMAWLEAIPRPTIADKATTGAG